MYHSFLIHSSADGHLGCFHVLAIYKQRCDEHWGTCVSFNSGFLSVYAQQWDCWIIRQFYFQFFKGISTLFSIVAVLVCIPTNNVRGFPFLHTLSSILSPSCSLNQVCFISNYHSKVLETQQIIDQFLNSLLL